MSREDRHGRTRREAGGIFVPAGLLIGLGVGFLIDQLVACLLIGLGVGLLLTAVAYAVMRN